MGMLRPKQKRDLDIVCTLRTEGPTNSVRKDVVRWTQMFVSKRRRQGRADLKSLITTTIGAGGPGVVWSHKKYDPYFDALGRAKIVVTCNPAEWEGDFRLWESLLSGALVFVDWITAFERMPYLLDKK